MKRKIVFISALLVSFFIGFAINEITDSSELVNQDFKRLVAQLKIDGVNILDTIETYEYGKFIQILDLEANKIELLGAL